MRVSKVTGNSCYISREVLGLTSKVCSVSMPFSTVCWSFKVSQFRLHRCAWHILVLPSMQHCMWHSLNLCWQIAISSKKLWKTEASKISSRELWKEKSPMTLLNYNLLQERSPLPHQWAADDTIIIWDHSWKILVSIFLKPFNWPETESNEWLSTLEFHVRVCVYSVLVSTKLWWLRRYNNMYMALNKEL